MGRTPRPPGSKTPGAGDRAFLRPARPRLFEKGMVIPMKQQTITWVGHGSWKMVTPSGTVIYVDPNIRRNPACRISLEDCYDADIVCITHGHDDHIGCGDAIEIAKAADATLVALADLCLYASHHGYPYDKGGGATGVGANVRVADCAIHCVHAEHTSAIWGYEYETDGVMMPGTGCCGFVIAPDGGVPVYFAGDTGIFSDMKLIGALYHPEVAVLPVGDKYVMGLMEASVAAGLIGARTVIPGHYDTWPPIRQNMDEFARLLAEHAPDCTLRVLKPGESTVCESDRH